MEAHPSFKKSNVVITNRALRRFALQYARRFVPTFAFFAVGMGLARGASLYWDTNGTTAGSGAATGTWGSSAFWSTDSTGSSATTGTLPANGDDVFFSAGTNGTTGTVTVSGAQAAHKITISDAVAITLSGGTSIDLGSATAGSGIFVTGAGNKTVSTPITMDSAATALSFSNTSTGTFTIGNVAGNATAGTQTITLANTNGSGSVVVSGNISDGLGGGNVAVTRSSGSGTITLSGTNTYTGATTISGMLLFTKEVSLYNDNTANWTAANLIVNSGGTAAFSVGGTGEFTSADVTTLLTNLSTVSSNGLKAGASIGFSTTNASGGTFTVANIIGDSTGTGGGAIGLTKLGTNALVLSGANTYTGVTLVTNGTVNVQNDQSAATGGWTISDNGFPAASGSPIVNFQAGSTVVVVSGKTVSLTTGDSSGQIMTLNVAGTVTNNGSLSDGRQSAVNINNGGNWTQNGTMTIATTSSTFGSANMTVNTGGTFTYNGASTIPLNPSGNNSGSATLNVAGGTFVTGKGIADGVSTNTGSGAANIILSGGGTLRLSANIATLATTTGSTLNFNLGTGGGVIDTNGFSTTITQNIANVSSQTGSLTKISAGKLTLSGTNNTYTGATNVNGGTLVVSGSLNGTLNVNVASGATLASGATGSITTATNGEYLRHWRAGPGRPWHRGHLDPGARCGRTTEFRLGFDAGPGHQRHQLRPGRLCLEWRLAAR
ncbi:autotransporter-associated beta strand repeat protein [Chthoniobacter flavus Ellin428]|uniref:Autotransporter-associated beta strand repeat protein n=1 Tax=Chthoniobacter flavus Ellin428 TaxID=497964 RepID=B4CX67_9BACT|nr:autotransporter-associated beta strand repeat-containing protein [Chthoniobacter flavus]EDY20865.1 autotransporter-associated beta strand repeat protein [Chthoniobacter flavus Ellin428]